MELQKGEIIKNYLLDKNLSVDERKERFGIAWDIREHLEEIKKEMRKKLLVILVNRIKESQEFLEYETKDDGLLDGQKFGGLRIYKKSWLLPQIGVVPLSYAIEAEKYNYYDLCLGIVKENNEKGIPFKGNWRNLKEIPFKWVRILSDIFGKLEAISKNWKVSDG